MKHSIVTRRTLSVLVENAPGVLSQVSRLFSRKGYNIESLAVGTTDDPAVSRITIEVTSDEAMIEQIMNQLRKLFPSTRCRSCCLSGPSAGSWSCSR